MMTCCIAVRGSTAGSEEWSSAMGEWITVTPAARAADARRCSLAGTSFCSTVARTSAHAFPEGWSRST